MWISVALWLVLCIAIGFGAGYCVGEALSSEEQKDYTIYSDSWIPYLPSPTPSPSPAPTPTATPKPKPVATPTPTMESVVLQTPAPMPMLVRSPSPSPVVRSDSSVQQQFIDGYTAAGVAQQWLDHFLYVVVPCESGWIVNPGGYHYGLCQFDPGTWNTVAGISDCWDYFSPYCQGFNAAIWSSMIDPGSTAGWPWCWHAY